MGNIFNEDFRDFLNAINDNDVRYVLRFVIPFIPRFPAFVPISSASKPQAVLLHE